ncbi:MAG: tRNA (guanosine(37)-N1)-methyltransferase TrmD [Deltaproteobacteria bacterium]|nr:tRNA (guanosine(37)-N1)-methyltransferase TrmD [Deltaproteobacteria bacterium]
MRFDVLTLMPEFFVSPLKEGVLGRAIEKGILEVHTCNIRDFTTDKHRTADDYPYGGGPGMVMKVEPIVKALLSLTGPGADRPKVILTTPQGKMLDHSRALELARDPRARYAVICGRYEGIDERVREFVDIELSVGDYILTGGEAAALIIMDAVGRLVPGVLGEEASREEDSFAEGLLEWPQYTRPEEFRGVKVPDVLLSGNHARIARWRRDEAIRRTYMQRPELLLKASGLSDEDRAFWNALKQGRA